MAIVAGAIPDTASKEDEVRNGPAAVCRTGSLTEDCKERYDELEDAEQDDEGRE